MFYNNNTMSHNHRIILSITHLHLYISTYTSMSHNHRIILSITHLHLHLSSYIYIYIYNPPFPQVPRIISLTCSFPLRRATASYSLSKLQVSLRLSLRLGLRLRLNLCLSWGLRLILCLNWGLSLRFRGLLLYMSASYLMWSGAKDSFSVFVFPTHII